MTLFTNLAARVRASTTDTDRPLDGEVFKALHEMPGDVWSQDVGSDDLWCRRDPEDTVAWDVPPRYTASLDAVNGERPATMRLTSLREHVRPDAAGPDWKPCACTLETLNREFKGYGASLQNAMLDAMLQVHAHLNGEA